MNEYLKNLEQRLQISTKKFVDAPVGSGIEKAAWTEMELLQDLVSDYKRHMRKRGSIT